MSQLRTEVPQMSSEEMDLWINHIVEYTHPEDIKTLHTKLDQVIEAHNTERDQQHKIRNRKPSKLHKH